MSAGGLTSIGLGGADHLARLKNSVRTVTACLSRDEQQISDPWDLLQSSYSRDYLSPGAPGETRLSLRRVHVIPEILLSQFEEGREGTKCFMGLLAPIGRAWMTIDNKLFLWDYATGRDFTCFEELEQVIINVSLVTPKAGIFIPSVRHVLVIVTASEVTLLGVSFGSEFKVNSNGSEKKVIEGSDLILHKTGLSFPTDEINLISVQGTRSGRIFAGGQDGNIYEFVYQSEDSWFSRKCKKINRTASAFSYLKPTFLEKLTGLNGNGIAIISMDYDEDRNLLYALGEDSSIHVFYLGRSDCGFERLAHSIDIFEMASRLCPTGALVRKGFKIISIHAVKVTDSAFIHLIAVTSSMIKLYFTTLRSDERAYSRLQLINSLSKNEFTPGHFDLIHVRLPPEDDHLDSRRLLRAFNPEVHTVFYQNGLMIAACSLGNQEDAIMYTALNQSLSLSSSHSQSQFHQRFACLESRGDLVLEGRIWDTSSVTSTFENIPLFASLSFAESICPTLQFCREYLLLTNVGVYVMSKSSPTEELKRILIETNGNMQSEYLKSFFDSYTPEQACFLAITLACSIQSSWRNMGPGRSNPSSRTNVPPPDPKVSANLAIWCVNLILHFGGEPAVIESSLNFSTARDANKFITSPNTTATSSNIRLPSLGSRIDYEFSHLHYGLYLFFSRLVSNFWNQPITKVQEPDYSTLMALHSFQEFLERNPSLSTRYAGKSKDSNVSSVTTIHPKFEEAYQAENESIKRLSWLIKATLELISFLSICRDYDVLSWIDNAGDLDFEGLLTTIKGREVITEIGNAMVQKQLKMGSSITSLCQVLVQRCPIFFGTTEIVSYQGIECLDRASNSPDTFERLKYLQESLKLFLSGATSMSITALNNICKQYERLAYFPGIIELCLAVAAGQDKEGIALLNLRNPNMTLSLSQQESISILDSIYLLIFEALKPVLGIELKSISPVLQSIDTEKLQRDTMAAAISAKDEVFHARLYEWLVRERLGHLLLDYETPYLLQFLENKFQERNEACRDLLWKYLARQGKYIESAQILDVMSKSPDLYYTLIVDFLLLVCSMLNLSERIERLSLALGNARAESNSVGVADGRADYIQELEERLDVAKLQNEILEVIHSEYGEIAEVIELNATLYDVTQLYNRFTRPMNLYECSLAIIHLSSFSDSITVHQLWNKIIENTLKGDGSGSAGGKKRFDMVAQKFTDLARKLYPSKYSFPLDFLFDVLLLLAKTNEQPASWLPMSILNTIISPEVAIEKLTSLTKLQGAYWSRSENIPYLVEAVVCLLEEAAIKSNRTSRSNALSLARSLQNIIPPSLRTSIDATNSLITKLSL